MKQPIRSHGSFADKINQKNKPRWTLAVIPIIVLVLTFGIVIALVIKISSENKLAGESIYVAGAEITSYDVPAYSGNPYVVINNNIPDLESDNSTQPFEYYSPLDEKGRCGPAFANISKESLPTEERESIGEITPSGWNNKKYEGIDQEYLYNRCHLIGFQLTGENANEKNLITGTRYMNTEGMLPFENTVHEYVEETGNHVLYRVTPIFDGDNLVASGVVMEARSVEDSGKDISFFVYVYNVQPGIAIDYATGDSCEQ